MTVRTRAKCIRLAPHEQGVTVSVDCPEASPSDRIARAARRRSAPEHRRSGAGPAGVATDERGYIMVDEGLATNVPGIWALGDCNGRGAFTHTAYNDFEIVAANLLDGERRVA